ncbi:hypothetical protein V5F77_01950 [Xanthobacter sp. DSM 24535]|uniref:hypothetical protein n=1 Tax=Roseixanthobacter psychrophilus TaxID=3119917 RepID=UPI00372AFAB8
MRYFSLRGFHPRRSSRTRLGAAGVFALLALGAGPGAALTVEGEGCAGGAWPLDRARAALDGATERAVSGARLPAAEAAVILQLVPLKEAGLPYPPTRLPADGGTFAGFLLVPAPPASGRLEVSLSQGGWIDLMQDGKSLTPVAFTGVRGCPGLRKSVRFDVAPTPLVLQLSGVAGDHVIVAVSSVP